MTIWADIEGYYGLYQVSNTGLVRSLDRFVKDKHGNQKILKGKILKERAQSSGHLAVSLSKKGVVSQFRVHRLVAKAFVSGIFEGAEVRHLDGNPRNNNCENLAWGSRFENTLDMYHRHGVRVGRKSHLAKYTEQEIAYVKKLKGKMSSQQASLKTGLCRGYISQIWRGDTGEARANAFAP